MRRSMPRMNASAEARYCWVENSSVTLIGMPWKMHSSIAVVPALVPGILMNRLLMSAMACRAFTSRIVPAESSTRSGETSSDAQPSTPSVRSWAGQNSSAARCRSSQGDLEEEALAGEAPRRGIADGFVVVLALLDRLVEDRGVRGEPCDRVLVDVPLHCSIVQHPAGDVVQPEALSAGGVAAPGSLRTPFRFLSHSVHQFIQMARLRRLPREPGRHEVARVCGRPGRSRRKSSCLNVGPGSKNTPIATSCSGP